jgi:predicted transcriptional regulator
MQLSETCKYFRKIIAINYQHFIHMAKTFSTTLKEYQASWGYKNNQMSSVLGISERMFAYYEKGKFRYAQTALLNIFFYGASPDHRCSD